MSSYRIEIDRVLPGGFGACSGLAPAVIALEGEIAAVAGNRRPRSPCRGTGWARRRVSA